MRASNGTNHLGLCALQHVILVGAGIGLTPFASSESRPTAAIPMENPYCSCKLTRPAADPALSALVDHYWDPSKPGKTSPTKSVYLYWCGAPQHGLSSKNVTLITSDYGIMCSLRKKRPF